MSFLLLLNAFLALSNQDKVSSYLNQVKELTVKDANSLAAPKIISENIAYSLLFSPLIIYGSVVLFFLIFLGAIAVQIIYRMLNWKRTVTALVVAIVIAGIPISVRTALEVTSLQTRASPDEIPKNVQIIQTSASSFTITWETLVAKVGAVKYGKAPLREDLTDTVIADMGKKSERHTAKIDNLEKVAYEFEILSGSKWYNNDGKPLKFQLTP